MTVVLQLEKSNANWPRERLQARDGYRANFAVVSLSGLVDTMVRGQQPSTVLLLPMIFANEDKDCHCDGNNSIDQNC